MTYLKCIFLETVDGDIHIRLR